MLFLCYDNYKSSLSLQTSFEEKNFDFKNSPIKLYKNYDNDKSKINMQLPYQILNNSILNLKEKYKNFITQIHEKNIEKYKDINIKEIEFDNVRIDEKMKKIAHKYIDNLYLNVSKLILVYKNVYI